MNSSSNNNNKLRGFNESVVIVNLTRNESNQQYKRQVCTDKTIQKTRSVGLHEHNNDEQKINDGKADASEPPEGSWQTKVSLGCVLSWSIHSSPRVRD